MTPDPNHGDDDLRRAFADLRREEATQAPSLTAVLERERGAAPRRALAPILGGALAGAALAASLVVGIAVRRPPPSPPDLVAFSAWRAPTDFLLRTPGSEMLDTVPRIGARPPLLALENLTAPPQPKRRSPSP